MESHKIIQVEETGSVYFWNQSGNRTFYERCGNADLYRGDKSEVTGLSRIQLCIPCTGWCRDQ